MSNQPTNQPTSTPTIRTTKDKQLIIGDTDPVGYSEPKMTPAFVCDPISSFVDPLPADSFQFTLQPDPNSFIGVDNLPHDFNTAEEADKASQKVKYFVPFSFDSYGKDNNLVDFTKPLQTDFKDRNFKCYRNKDSKYKWNDCRPCDVTNAQCEALNTEEQCLQYKEYCDWDRSTRCKNKLSGVSRVYASSLCDKDREGVNKNFCITDLKNGSPKKPALYKPDVEHFTTTTTSPTTTTDTFTISSKQSWLIFLIVILLSIIIFPSKLLVS